MIRVLLAILLVSIFGALSAQEEFPAENISLISRIHPNKDSLGHGYSGCWGWYQEEKNREYALLGGTNGTYFVDVTDPANPKICDFVHGDGPPYCIWREIKSYKNYCYVASQCQGGLQIIDMKYLPDSVHVVSTGTNVLYQCHTIWIDNDKIYCGLLNKTPYADEGFGVFSLENPENPIFLRGVCMDYPFIYAHDLYARNDTIFACDPSNGIMILKLEQKPWRFVLLGTYTGYKEEGYTHSCALTQNGKYLIFCDEVPASLPIHLVDVNNFENIQKISDFLPYIYTTPHNPYVLGNDFAVVSCYEDGLFIYDISKPDSVKLSGFFDTHPQYGFLQGEYSGGYNGNWGAYPYLPSKTIIALDMTNGAFLLDASKAFGKPTSNSTLSNSFDCCSIIYTTPASKQIHIKAKAQQNGEISLISPEGKVLYSVKYSENVEISLNTENLANAMYILSVGGNDCRQRKKILITHY